MSALPSAGGRSALRGSHKDSTASAASGPAAQTSADVPPNLDLMRDLSVSTLSRLVSDPALKTSATLRRGPPETDSRTSSIDVPTNLLDGRHGHGARARKIERDAADTLASACSRLRVLVRYARTQRR